MRGVKTLSDWRLLEAIAKCIELKIGKNEAMAVLEFDSARKLYATIYQLTGQARRKTYMDAFDEAFKATKTGRPLWALDFAKVEERAMAYLLAKEYLHQQDPEPIGSDW